MSIPFYYYKCSYYSKYSKKNEGHGCGLKIRGKSKLFGYISSIIWTFIMIECNGHTGEWTDELMGIDGQMDEQIQNGHEYK